MIFYVVTQCNDVKDLVSLEHILCQKKKKRVVMFSLKLLQKSPSPQQVLSKYNNTKMRSGLFHTV